MAAVPVAAQSNTETDGSTLFAVSGCTQCHGATGLGTGKGPSLREVRRELTEEQMRLQIKEGGRTMPPFGEALTDPQIASLIKFLRSKNAWKEQPATASKSSVSK